MCVIYHILPTKDIPHDKLFNSAANNWHSWGIVVKNTSTNKLEVYREVPENADKDESNPLAGGCHCDIAKIEKILEDNKQYERFVHLRHATKGHINMSNCHPFEIRNDDERQVMFMHNGSFGGNLGVTVNSYGQAFTSDQKLLFDAPSDTSEFIDKFLKVPLLEFVGGDYTNTTFQTYIWSNLYRDKGLSSRVIFIANDLPCMKSGAWQTVTEEGTQDVRYYASNLDYCDRITRGPLFRQIQEQERKEREKKAAEIRAQNKGEPEVVGTYVHGMFQPDPEILKGLTTIFQTFGSGLEPNELACLGECSTPEFEAIVSTLIEKGEINMIAGFLDFVMTSYMELYATLEQVTRKHESSTKKIAELMKEKETGNVSVLTSHAA